MTIERTARDFFEACETGLGWAACKSYCSDNAGFACQADALAEISSLEAYADWMKGLLGPIPNGHYELTAFAVDEGRGRVVATAQFHGTQTGDGGPVPPTGKVVVSDYAHVMTFADGKIRHVTKIWNDAQALRQIGWA
ncbi:ester cyclase [Aliiruegeria sabulilitoris]|uniref:ester cyclase n=1 Tax=Aliiruegeria sabulilitoris TaxID=1510458 RepID=UPI00083486F4|nr:nuclear transport factor 2 family protein [Aliiruegeria sabulilitoris]NDR56183.1 nuclear transport factor 2 family protein [Pseudoruegeria sp. M32A2M]